MNEQSKCPFSSAMPKHSAGQGTANQDWWSNRLNLNILRRHSSLSNPMPKGFSYREAFKQLDLQAVKQDLSALMTASRVRHPCLAVQAKTDENQPDFTQSHY